MGDALFLNENVYICSAVPKGIVTYWEKAHFRSILSVELGHFHKVSQNTEKDALLVLYICIITIYIQVGQLFSLFNLRGVQALHRWIR